MNQKRAVAQKANPRRREGILARLLVRLRRLLSRPTGRKAKKNPNIYPLY